MREICPGCHARVEAGGGPVHRYIGASPGCWDVYTRLLAGEPPMREGSLHPLIVDAYAAQHPGDDSPQATQSVAVHLVVLEAVLGHGMRLDMAVPIRIATVETGRRGYGFPKLEPVPQSWDLTIADVAGEETEAERGAAGDRYVPSVWETWKALHGRLIEDWHRTVSRQLER